MGWPALVASVMVGSGALLVAHVTQAWQLYLAYGVMIGFLGQGALFTPLMANASHWFNHRRGMAIGVVASGQSWPVPCGRPRCATCTRPWAGGRRSSNSAYLPLRSCCP